MLFKLTLDIPKDIDEEDAELKTRMVLDPIYAKFPQLSLKGINGHISLSMQDHAFKVWIFIYDEDGISETEVNGKIKKHNSIIAKRGIIRPTKTNINSIDFGVSKL